MNILKSIKTTIQLRILTSCKIDFIYNAIIDISLKANTFIIFEYIFEAKYIDIPLVINLKIDYVLEKDFNIDFKKI